MKFYYGIVLACLIIASPCGAVITLTAPTSDFTAIGLGGPSDPIADNQANRVDLELVGNDAAGPFAFYLKFDDGGTPDKTDGENALGIFDCKDRSTICVKYIISYAMYK